VDCFNHWHGGLTPSARLAELQQQLRLPLVRGSKYEILRGLLDTSQFILYRCTYRFVETHHNQGTHQPDQELHQPGPAQRQPRGRGLRHRREGCPRNDAPAVQQDLDQLAGPTDENPGLNQTIDRYNNDDDRAGGPCRDRPSLFSDVTTGNAGDASHGPIPHGIVQGERIYLITAIAELSELVHDSP
jgi:hypothetical protein